jgi:Zn-dependent protease with chaperone function
MNADAFQAQASETTGLFDWLAEHVSTHPNLPKRLHAVRYFAAMRHATPVPAPGPAPMIYNPR